MLLVIQNQPVDDHPRKVFVSYSHEDEDWKLRVVEALRPLEQQRRIAAWHDRKLLPGENWDGKIKDELNAADVILFLVSQTFIDSSYCRQVEVRRAVERSDAGEAVLVPIIVRRCEWQKEPFARFQAYPLDGSPLEESTDEATRLTDLREKLNLALLGWWYPRRPRVNGGSHAMWQLQFRPPTGVAMPSEQALVQRLRELSGEPDIVSCGQAQEQATGARKQPIAPVLLLDGPTSAFAALEREHREGRLSGALGVEVVSLQLVLGATMQTATEVTDGVPAVAETGENLLMIPSLHETPDLPQMVLVRDEQPGWMLVLPMRGAAATPRALFAEAQARFSAYLGTIPAVQDGRLTVNLSTYEPDHTLPEALKRTRLGHDLMDQDCLLKQYAASLLHPDTETGRAFWQALTAQARALFGTDRVPLRVFQKVWVVPGQANVHEKTPAKPFGYAFPASFGVRDTDRACTVESCDLRVLCEADYLAMQQHQVPAMQPTEDMGVRAMNEAAVVLFRELILPGIVTEVNAGTHFATLRQIYHAFVLATWFRRTLKDVPAYAAVFRLVNQGHPENFGVQRSDEWMTADRDVYARYLRLFNDGVFRCARNLSADSEARPSTRIYFSGGVVLEQL